MMVLGTACTRYDCERLGNSCASTTSARTMGVSIAIACASLATVGQCGQVGVTKTCRCTGLSSLWSAFRVECWSVLVPLDAAMMSSMRVRTS